jgi:hypothetical protein
MIEILLIILIILFLTGNFQISGSIPHMVLFNINRQPITLWNLLIFLLILWIIGLLPTPLREISGVLLILWILSILGFIAFAGLSNLIIIAIIVGIIASILRK